MPPAPQPPAGTGFTQNDGMSARPGDERGGNKSNPVQITPNAAGALRPAASRGGQDEGGANVFTPRQTRGTMQQLGGAVGLEVRRQFRGGVDVQAASTALFDGIGGTLEAECETFVTYVTNLGKGGDKLLGDGVQMETGAARPTASHFCHTAFGANAPGGGTK